MFSSSERSLSDYLVEKSLIDSSLLEVKSSLVSEQIFGDICFIPFLLKRFTRTCRVGGFDHRYLEITNI